MLLQKAKLALRISNSAYDEEIEDLIEGARQDLKIAGLSSEKVKDDEDPLIKRAIITYCKANFGYDEKADQFQHSYEMLKQHLSLSGDYHV